MTPNVRVFVSYSHRDAEDLDPLLDYLRGLEREGVELWTDRKIATGELWDDRIRDRIAASDVALVLVSQAFLDSAYCQDVEISGFLDRSVPIFPVLLGPCEWQRHAWLRERQFLPGGEETIREHYTDRGARERLFLRIRTELRELLDRIRAERPVPSNPFHWTLAIRDPARFVGREAERRRLQELLAGGSAVILGPSKMGKSSLLVELGRTWEGEVLGPIDFQAVADRDDFFRLLAEALGVEGDRWPQIRKVLRERQALLLLDEIDAGPERGFRTADLGLLRAASGENPQFKIAVVSRRPLKGVFPDSGGSEVFNFLQPFTLGPMPEEEIRRLLAHPWALECPAFDEATVDDLVRLAGGHPFKAQRAAFHRYQTLSDPGCDWHAAWTQDMEQML